MNEQRRFRTTIGMPLDTLSHLTNLSRWVLRAIEMGYREATNDEKEIIAKFLGMKPHVIFPSNVRSGK